MLIILTRDHLWHVHGEVGHAREDVLGGVGGEVRDQLVVDGQVGGEDEEVADALDPVQVGDEGPHEPGLADARRQGEAERGELPLEVRHARVKRPHGVERRIEVLSLFEGEGIDDLGEDLERSLLRRAQAHGVAEGRDGCFHSGLVYFTSGG
ncbi:hypothetical protein D3C86_1145160 [compost metagenome]